MWPSTTTTSTVRALAVSFFLSLAMTAFAAAAPKCTTFSIPVTASAPTQLFSSVPSNITNPTVLAAYLSSSGSAGLGALLGAAGTVISNGTYDISMQYCEASTNSSEQVPESRKKTIQFLVHGVTYTKSYWSGLGYADEYSWIDYATTEGYATLAIDNLGNGESSHPDALLLAQQTVQVEIMHQIIGMLRAGRIPNELLKGRAFERVLFVGHSYGSICGNALATHHPSDIDTFILTGYTPYFLLGAIPIALSAPFPANIAYPSRYASILDPLYLVQTLKPGRQHSFYTSSTVGGFSPSLLDHDFATEGTVALGELATILYGLGPADAYSGNVLVVTGEDDGLVCDAGLGVLPPSCGSGSGKDSLPQQAGAFFPAAGNFTVYIPPRTGHDVNLHYSAQESFRIAHDYLEERGF